MSVAHIINLSHGYSGRVLFEGVGFQVEKGDKIGLVGPNGSGKTTLMRLLSGEIPPQSGAVRFGNGLRTGYLPQDVQEALEGGLLSFILGSVPGRRRLQEEARRLEEQLTQGGSYREQEVFSARLAEIHAEIGDLDVLYPVHEAEKILSGLGFSEEEFSRPVSSLSGGWKMRAALASLLYRKPDLLLLDEPTNHLDIPSVRWLEQYLDAFPGALILVCHDRYFLNRRIKRVISFEPEGLRFHAGNFDDYLEAREEERKTLENRARNQEIKVKEAQRFIERFRSKASKARQAQSKIKLVKKMELVKTHNVRKAVRFRFPEIPRSGRIVLEVSGMSKRYGDMTLYRSLDLNVLRGERVGVIGPNGSGKTTLLRIIEGEVEPDAGEVRLGHGVTKSYYAQHHSEMLDMQRTVLEEVYRVVPHESVSFVRGVCGAFLFPGDDVDKTVGLLSGGEKARVCLARIMVKPGNFLVMDEPTNHLDLFSSEALIDALAEYDGTLLFVSHNLAFVNRLATKIWDLQGGEIIEYPGTLEEYEAHLAENEAARENAFGERAESCEKTLQSRKGLRKERAEKRRRMQEALGPLKKALHRTEQEIHRLETRQKELEKDLADPDVFKDAGRSVPLLREYDRLKQRLEDLMEDWERTQKQMDTALCDIGEG